VKQIDRPKLTENVARESLMHYRDRTIEFIAPVALAAMINEYAIFGPKLSDRLSSFFGVSLSEHLVEIAFNEDLYSIGHSSLAYLRGMIPLILRVYSRRYGASNSKKSRNDTGDHPLLRDLNALRISSTNSFGCSKAAKCPPLSSSFQ
jgi:hypothetical protein